jgi:hypothetical protein
MSIVRINAIDVPEGRGEALEERFRNRVGEVERMPGFLGFELLRPTGGESRYFVYTLGVGGGVPRLGRERGVQPRARERRSAGRGATRRDGLAAARVRGRAVGGSRGRLGTS